MIKRWIVIVLAVGLGACGDQRSARHGSENIVPSEVGASNTVVANAAARATAPPNREPIGYTSLKPADCKLLEQSVEEGGYSRHRCNGIAGYALETSESDLRQGLTVIAPDGTRSELDLSAQVAKGAFNALGPAAEWRGADRKSPSALIVRLNVARPEPATPDTSYLVVFGLGDPTCILRVIPPGPSQNDAARDIADGSRKDCLKD